ncbi:unnamed protein product [Coccothraustes coccothraustes]
MPHSALSSTGKPEQLLRMSLQSHGWWCGTDGARVTSRLFSGPCKQSRPMTCSIVPFEEEASSVTTKKNQGVPLLTIGSSSWLQREVLYPCSHMLCLFQVCSCHSISQQGCVCCSTNCRAREANLRSMHTVIPSVVSFKMCSALASEFCLTDQAVAARIGAAFAQCFVPGIPRRAREREDRHPGLLPRKNRSPKKKKQI